MIERTYLCAESHTKFNRKNNGVKCTDSDRFSGQSAIFTEAAILKVFHSQPFGISVFACVFGKSLGHRKMFALKRSTDIIKTLFFS